METADRDGDPFACLLVEESHLGAFFETLFGEIGQRIDAELPLEAARFGNLS